MRCVSSTLSRNDVKGFCTAVTCNPFGCNRAITSDQHEPLANNTWPRTILRALGKGCAWLCRIKMGLAMLASTIFTNVRRFIGYLLPPDRLFDNRLPHRGPLLTAGCVP